MRWTIQWANGTDTGGDGLAKLTGPRVLYPTRVVPDDEALVENVARLVDASADVLREVREDGTASEAALEALDAAVGEFDA